MFATCAPCTQLYVTQDPGADRCHRCRGPLRPVNRDEAHRFMLRVRDARQRFAPGAPAVPQGGAVETPQRPWDPAASAAEAHDQDDALDVDEAQLASR